MLMTDEAKLLKLYGEWKRLAQAEAASIASSDWAAVAKSQEEKKALAGEIAKLEGQQSTLEPILRELIAAEQENARALIAKRDLLNEEQFRLHQATRNLRQMQQAYGGGNLPGWHSYS